jgi:hypothetical protein
MSRDVELQRGALDVGSWLMAFLDHDARAYVHTLARSTDEAA